MYRTDALLSLKLCLIQHLQKRHNQADNAVLHQHSAYTALTLGHSQAQPFVRADGSQSACCFATDSEGSHVSLLGPIICSQVNFGEM